MKILVTGGAGFIGSNVVDAYIEAGHSVAVVDNLSSGKAANLNPLAEFYLTDVRSEEIKKVFEIERPEVVNHHAAQISVPASVEDPRRDAEVNVIGFINVLEAAVRSQTRKVVFISSGGAVYGEAAEYPTSEAYIPRPLSPYAITKYVSENYLDFYRHCHGLDYTVLRYANVYGPRQVPHGEAGVVAIFMDRLLKGSRCTLYHFEDDPRGMTRDYCHVRDVARANLLALSAGSGGAYNIGTSVATHTEDLFRAIYRGVKEAVPGLSDSLASPLRAGARPGDLRRSCLDIARAGRTLGWAPEITLEQGIRLTLEWRLKERKGE
jgi:UDP-glucose 4-epimerase